VVENISPKRPPYDCSRLALDEADLTLSQWMMRIIMGILGVPILLGFALFFPPKRVNVSSEDVYDESRWGISASQAWKQQKRLQYCEALTRYEASSHSTAELP
jgi:hypothetical protein